MGDLKIHKAELLLGSNAILGEGPVWDWKNQLLYWVDIEAGKLYRHNPSNGENQKWDFGEMIGAAVPTGSGKMLLALESGLATHDFETDTLTRHNVLENHDPEMRFNDGKVGPNGNFWIGSMHKQFVPKTGNMYRVTSDFRTSVSIPKTTISNGMAWTSDQKLFYYIDSPSFEVVRFDYDPKNSAISNRQTAFKIPKDFGSPDGMSIDEEDMLWIAHWGGHCIRRWNPLTGGVLEKIKIPAPQVTSCCFGGKNLETLYITTARSGMSKAQLAEFPLSGGLFICRPGISGTPLTYFKD